MMYEKMAIVAQPSKVIEIIISSHPIFMMNGEYSFITHSTNFAFHFFP